MPTEFSAYEDRIINEIRQTPEEYLPHLLQIVRLFRESVTLKSAEASFRQGWHEAMMGQTRPVSELWESIEADLETISLSTNPQFLALIERSRARQKREGGISGDEMSRRLGLG